MSAGPLYYTDLLDPSFQELLLAKLGRDRDFLARSRPIVQPGYFHATVHAILCESLFTFWDKNRELPTPIIWQNAAIEMGIAAGAPRSQVLMVLQRILETPDADLPRDFLAERVVSFAQRAEGGLAVDTAAGSLRDFDLADLQAELKRILDFPSRFLSLGLNVRTDWTRVLFKDPGIIFPTGQQGMDRAMRGAMQAGELVMVVAPMKTGKTMMLLNMALGMALLGYYVLYYTLEMYPRDITRRALSILTGIPTNDLPTEATSRLIAAMEALNEYTPGQLVVKDFPPATIGMADIDGHAEQVEQTTGERHALFVDYVDLLAWEGDEYKALCSLYQEGRALGAKRKVPFVTASQTNAGGFTAPTLGAQHLSGSSRKAFVVDWGWGLEQTPLDYQLNRFILTLSYGRHERKQQKVFYFANYATGAIEEVTEDRYVARGAGVTPLPTPPTPIRGRSS